MENNYDSVVVWSKNNCPHCVSAKTLLNTKGIQYEERRKKMTVFNKKKVDFTKEKIFFGEKELQK